MIIIITIIIIIDGSSPIPSSLPRMHDWSIDHQREWPVTEQWMNEMIINGGSNMTYWHKMKNREKDRRNKAKGGLNNKHPFPACLQPTVVVRLSDLSFSIYLILQVVSLN